MRTLNKAKPYLIASLKAGIVTSVWIVFIAVIVTALTSEFVGDFVGLFMLFIAYFSLYSYKSLLIFNKFLRGILAFYFFKPKKMLEIKGSLLLGLISAIAGGILQSMGLVLISIIKLFTYSSNIAGISWPEEIPYYDIFSSIISAILFGMAGSLFSYSLFFLFRQSEKFRGNY